MSKLAQSICPSCGLNLFGLRMDKHLKADNRIIKGGCPRCDFSGEFRILATEDSRPLPFDLIKEN